MKMYLASLLTGVVMGAFYALVEVRSPAPPLVALLGLLGMLLGEQGLNAGARVLRARPAPASTSERPTHSRTVEK